MSPSRAAGRVAPVLAVDGGNSKTDAALLDARGRVLGVGRGRGSSQQTSGPEESSESLLAAVAGACRAAGLDEHARPVAHVGVYCLAGVDLPVDERRVGSAVRSLGLSRSNVVLNDTFAVLRAGTDRGWGVAVVCGAGMNCLGVSPDGRTVRFPALGPISGDWGSGLSIGMAALGAAVRSKDGRGARTALDHLVPAHFGLPRPAAVTEAIYMGRLGQDRLMELVPVVFAASRDGDGAAAGIVDRLAAEVVAMSTAAIRRLRMAGEDVDVVLGGGVFRNRDERLLGAIDEGIARVAPLARIRMLDAPPVVGAALIGLDHLAAASDGSKGARASASAAASRRVRSALADVPLDTAGTRAGG